MLQRLQIDRNTHCYDTEKNVCYNLFCFYHSDFILIDIRQPTLYINNLTPQPIQYRNKRLQDNKDPPLKRMRKKAGGHFLC